MNQAEGLEKIKAFIDAVHPLHAEEWEAFSQVWQPFSCKRKTLLTAAGHTEKHLYFVLEGVQRAFYLDDQDREATIVFSYPYSFGGVADSFLLQAPSKYFFESLTNSQFLRCTAQQVFDLMHRYQNFERLILKFLSISLSGVLERQVELQCFTAEEKFRKLLSRSPHVLRLIPHKYLASYLGIDATNFSKLLGSVRL
jgi:CRP-like cAMP-binding protein